MKLQDFRNEDRILEELGHRLARVRKSRGLSQQELADQAFVSRPTISKAENGRPIQTPEFIKVLSALGFLSALDAAIPEPRQSPLQSVKGRASRKTAKNRNKQDDAGDTMTWPEDKQ